MCGCLLESFSTSTQYKIQEAKKLLEEVTGEKPVIVNSLKELLKAVDERKKAIIFYDIHNEQ